MSGVFSVLDVHGGLLSRPASHLWMVFFPSIGPFWACPAVWAFLSPCEWGSLSGCVSLVWKASCCGATAFETHTATVVATPDLVEGGSQA